MLTHADRQHHGHMRTQLPVPLSGSDANSYINAVEAPATPTELVGFLSPMAKTYLSDVLDHVDSVLSSLELYSGLAQNLVGAWVGNAQAHVGRLLLQFYQL